MGTTCDTGSVLDPANPDIPGGSGRGSKDPRRDDVCSPTRALGAGGWGSVLTTEYCELTTEPLAIGGAVGVGGLAASTALQGLLCGKWNLPGLQILRGIKEYFFRAGIKGNHRPQILKGCL